MEGSEYHSLTPGDDMKHYNCTNCGKHRILCGYCDKPKPKYQLMVDDWHDEPFVYEAHWNDDKEDAALRWVEDNYGELEYPDSVEITVFDMDGDGTKFEITAEPSVSFSSIDIT